MAGSLVWAAVGLWAGLGVHASVTDLRHGIIRRRAVWTAGAGVAALLAAAASVGDDHARFGWAVAAAAIVGLFLEVCYRLAPANLGFGDVRLIVANSILAGWWGIQWPWWALCAGAVAAWPAALRAVLRDGARARVRWAPGLAVGAGGVVAYLLWSAGPAG